MEKRWVYRINLVNGDQHAFNKEDVNDFVDDDDHVLVVRMADGGQYGFPMRQVKYWRFKEETVVEKRSYTKAGRAGAY